MIAGWSRRSREGCSGIERLRDVCGSAGTFRAGARRRIRSAQSSRSFRASRSARTRLRKRSAPAAPDRSARRHRLPCLPRRRLPEDERPQNGHRAGVELDGRDQRLRRNDVGRALIHGGRRSFAARALVSPKCVASKNQGRTGTAMPAESRQERFQERRASCRLIARCANRGRSGERCVDFRPCGREAEVKHRRRMLKKRRQIQQTLRRRRASFAPALTSCSVHERRAHREQRDRRDEQSRPPAVVAMPRPPAAAVNSIARARRRGEASQSANRAPVPKGARHSRGWRPRRAPGEYQSNPLLKPTSSRHTPSTGECEKLSPA